MCNGARLIILALAAALSVRSIALAGALAPSKAGQLVTLEPGGSCAQIFPAQEMSFRLNSDGTITPFSVPSGQVLVVTGFAYLFCGQTAGTMVGCSLGMSSANGGAGLVSDVVAVSSNGCVAGHPQMSPIAFKPGTSVCLACGSSFPSDAEVYGFLAPDK
jgi:hypothetical protein